MQLKQAYLNCNIRVFKFIRYGLEIFYQHFRVCTSNISTNLKVSGSGYVYIGVIIAKGHEATLKIAESGVSDSKRYPRCREIGLYTKWNEDSRSREKGIKGIIGCIGNNSTALSPYEDRAGPLTRGRYGAHEQPMVPDHLSTVGEALIAGRKSLNFYNEKRFLLAKL